MSGGFQVQEGAIQQAINHLQALLTEAQSNQNSLPALQHLQQPGAAQEMAQFHQAAVTSVTALTSQHSDFVQSVQNQITQLQQQLQQYQTGEEAAGSGFGQQ